MMTIKKNRWVETTPHYEKRKRSFEKAVGEYILRVYYEPEPNKSSCSYSKYIDGVFQCNKGSSYSKRFSSIKNAKRHVERRFANRDKPVKRAKITPKTDEDKRLRRIARKIANAIYNADKTLGKPIEDGISTYDIGDNFAQVYQPFFFHFGTPPKKRWEISVGVYIQEEGKHYKEKVKKFCETYFDLDDAEKAVNELCKRAVKELVK